MDLSRCRFGTNFLMLTRLQACRLALQKMVTSQEWEDWKECLNPKDLDAARSVEDIILRSVYLHDLIFPCM